MNHEIEPYPYAYPYLVMGLNYVYPRCLTYVSTYYLIILLFCAANPI